MFVVVQQLCANITLLPYCYLSGLLDKKTHGGVAFLYAIEKAFWGRKILNALNWNTLAKLSPLFLGIELLPHPLCYSPQAGAPVKKPRPVLISLGKEVVSL